MKCNHTNPAGYVFCGTCGAALEYARCRCGFVTGVGELFCGQCGINLIEQAAGSGRAGVFVDQRFDLDHLAQQAAQEKQFLGSTDKARVTQDDIRKLLTTRRKRF
ncbi:MAG TPA: zinc ribbon domain-containing protein [Gallionella sp.]|nr:zinc ribbon domain-containing protein [Gallionella sp.]